MTAASALRAFGFALAVCIAPGVLAQTAPAAADTYQPTEGQAGKDVVWVPTPQALADRMLDLAKVTSRDYVMDLGSGDGRTVITAAKRGARALGIEYNPDLVALSQRIAAREGVAERARFEKADLFESDFSQATVITMFLLPDINMRLRPRLLDLKPGTRIVSNSFHMEDWEADETVQLDVTHGCTSGWCKALLWIVPAKVAGTHKVAQGELTLEQKFQMLTGTLASGGKTVPVEGKVVGEDILLKAGGRTIRGKANGQRVEFF